jgi:hypothetical protein
VRAPRVGLRRPNEPTYDMTNWPRPDGRGFFVENMPHLAAIHRTSLAHSTLRSPFFRR